MDRLSRRLLGIWAVAGLPGLAAAQEPGVPDPKVEAAPKVEVGGTSAVDMITLRALGPGAPLRFGNVIPSSERVQLDGRILTAGQDYGMDYATGVVYLKTAQKAGQVLTVSYRYSSKAAPTTKESFSGIGAFRYDLAPGALGVVVGYGMTERTADGNVMTSNLFGFNNSVRMGAGELKGIFLMGERQKTEIASGLQMDPNAKPGEATAEEGSSRLILQNFNTGALGGKISLDYQDVSKNFTGFGALREAGYDAKDIERLSKERGLSRMGLSMQDVDLGGLKVSNSFRNVRDADAGIEWRSFGVESGSFKLSFDAQKVDQDFKRFRDLSEGNREQLMKERGMSRENLAAKLGGLSFSSNRILEDGSGNGITRREIGLDVSGIKFDLGEQEIDKGFNRFDSLLAKEKAEWGREAGLRRQWMNLQATLFGATNPLAFSQSLIASDEGSFASRDLSFKGSSWSLQHSGRNVEKGFASLDKMGNEEMGRHIQAIGAMYGLQVREPMRHRNAFLGGRGIERTWTSIDTQPFKGWNFAFSTLALKGQEDKGQLDRANLKAGNLQIDYSRMSLGEKFRELTSLMDFEKQRLGQLAGLSRTDLGLNMKFSEKTSFSLTHLNANTSDGGARRTAASFKDPKLEIDFGIREVDPGFTAVRQLVDAERHFLHDLRGFSQRDLKVKWDVMPNMKFEHYMLDAMNGLDEEERMVRNTIFNWAPDTKTHLHYTRLEQRSNDPLAVLFANMVERFSFSRDFGGFALKVLDEKARFDGENAQSPDWHKQYMGVQAKLDDKTRVSAEQTRKTFSNGEHEHVQAKTVSTEISRNLGVSVSDVNIDRSGEDNNEVKRNYGFWFDFGNGLRLSYGYARHLTGDAGTMNSMVSLGTGGGEFDPGKVQQQVGSVKEGQVGSFNVGAAHGINRWDEVNTQNFSRVGISTARPITLGPLRDVRMSFGLDSATDYGNWVRENKLFKFDGRLGANQMGYEYVSQMHQSGVRGIDRTFRLGTDPDERRWLRASIFYKVRTLPWDDQVMIRNFDVTARPVPNMQITHQLVTNPEGPAQPNVLLGTVPQAHKLARWKVDYKASSDFTFGGSWEELINEQNNTMRRTGGLDLTLFAGSGSPLNVFFGLEQSDIRDERRTVHRYHIRYDQKPGPNQTFSFFVGNVSYLDMIEESLKRENWTFRLDYQLRF
jgi:hypothetical protein